MTSVEEPRVDDLCELRYEARATIIATAVVLTDSVIARVTDPETRALAEQMRELLAVEHGLCAAIKAQVG